MKQHQDILLGAHSDVMLVVMDDYNQEGRHIEKFNTNAANSVHSECPGERERESALDLDLWLGKASIKKKHLFLRDLG